MRITLAFASTLLLAACASGGATDTITRGSPTTTTIENGAGNYDLQMVPETRTSSDWVRATRERVWAALPQVYEEIGVAPGTIDPDEWLFGSRDVRVSRIAGERPSEFFDCGRNPIGAPVANTARIQLEILTSLKGIGDGTQVETTILARARQRSGSATDVNCTSTGRLETLIARRLGEITGAAS